MQTLQEMYIRNVKWLKIWVSFDSLLLHQSCTCISNSLCKRIKLANKVCFCIYFVIRQWYFVCLHTCVSFQQRWINSHFIPEFDNFLWTLCHVLIKLHIFQVTFFAIITFSSSQSVYLSYRWMFYLRCGRSVGHRVWVSSCTCPIQQACEAEVCNTNNKIYTSLLVIVDS